MTVKWLGQAGLLFENENIKILIDPYLSDSLSELDPVKARRVPVLESLFDIKPDAVVFTHNHRDHYDPETAVRFIRAETDVTVLAPTSVWEEVRKIGGANNFVLFNALSRWTENGVKFTAVPAEHSDPYAIGVIIDDGKKIYYVTGDTLYNERIFKELPNDIYAVFLPVNGVGNNMNMTDAKEFCERIKPEIAVPVHCGLLDDIDMNMFNYKAKVVPEIYKIIEV